MPYLPPAVVAFLIGLMVCGVLLMMLAIRVRMRDQLEPLSRPARWLIAAVLGGLAATGYLLFRMAERVLDF